MVHVNRCSLERMGRLIDIDDLIDAEGVARILGLSHRNSVSAYLRRYPDMPRPVIDLGRGRPMLWLEAEVIEWSTKTGRHQDPGPPRRR